MELMSGVHGTWSWDDFVDENLPSSTVRVPDDSAIELDGAHVSDWGKPGGGCGAEAIVCGGGIEAVVRAMQTNPHSVEVQEKGCGALQKLAAAFQHTRENQTRIASAGGIEVVVRAMQANPHSVEVQEKGCGALWSLASSHAENQTRIASAGGIEAVVRATQMIRAHPCRRRDAGP
jgi:hypothetical protein